MGRLCAVYDEHGRRIFVTSGNLTRMQECVASLGNYPSRIPPTVWRPGQTGRSAH